MSEIIRPVFTCPGCSNQVEGVGDYIARGMKCPICGVGFIPVERKTKWKDVGARPFLPMKYWLWLGVSLLVVATGTVLGVLVLAAFAPLWFWLAAILFALLLIAFQVSRLRKRGQG